MAALHALEDEIITRLKRKMDVRHHPLFRSQKFQQLAVDQETWQVAGETSPGADPPGDLKAAGIQQALQAGIQLGIGLAAIVVQHDPERLATLLQDWLRKWAEPAARDELLSAPALAAALVYSKVMRAAYEAPAITRDGAVAERARTFLEGLTGAGGPRLTAFGEALEGRYPDAFDAFRRRMAAGLTMGGVKG